MDALNDISDEEFVPFLNSLGVETYQKSFEWMLNDPDFAGVLRWLYDNLDQNNALTAREEYRYKELQKKGTVLSPDDLKASIALIEQDHPGICLPGDQEAKEDVKFNIQMCKERLNILERQEAVVKDLTRQNELTKDGLTQDLICLNSAYQQCTQDEAEEAKACTMLSVEIDTITNEVIDVIAENLKVYANCRGNKVSAMRFIVFNPLESYRQSQALFRSHSDLYVSKNHMKRRNEISDEDLRSTLLETNCLEERLLNAALEYVESTAELSGQQAKLDFVTNYNNVHSSQIPSCLMEARRALDLLEQEENIMQQQIQNAVEAFVKARTNLVVGSVALAALNVMQQIEASLTHLIEVWQQAFALDRLLYFSLRHELRTLEEFLRFASQLRQYVVSESTAVASRLETMKEICQEQASCTLKLQNTDPLIQTLCTILGVPPSNDTAALVAKYNNLKECIKGLKDNMEHGFKRKENALVEFKCSTNHIREYIWSGCTKQANSWDRTVASLLHSLKQEMDNVDKQVVEAGTMFTAVKGGDKQNLRKLWQWFLTDPPRLLSLMKSCRSF